MTRLFPSMTLGALLLGTALPAAAAVPSVATDMPVTQSLVAMVMGDLGEPSLVMSQGGDPHHYQMRPSEARALANADLLVWIGPALTPWLDRSADERTGPSLVLLEAEGTHVRQFLPGEGDDDEHDEHGHDEAGHEMGGEAHAAEHGEEHGDGHGDGHGHHHADGTDPHAWLDPANARAWVLAIAQELSTLDPGNAATYAANAQAAAAGLEALDARLTTVLAPVKDKPFVVFHDAYGYFADHYGLNVVGQLSLGDASAPGAARMSQLRETLVADHALCAFPETNHDPALMETLVEGTDVTLGRALSPTGTEATLGATLYPETLTAMAETIAACLK
ncbi:zinc ABC transporter substrate-binding protein [Frigidibacter sp. MR17.24]|uniref:zinc ABC transporter substrate-binding protein n=1 Tax=Frigidibacter sp. MR17.24 TaxID=3127345 RepID=UPI003012DEE0